MHTKLAHKVYRHLKQELAHAGFKDNMKTTRLPFAHSHGPIQVHIIQYMYTL
jgi:hypothetical protein